MSARPSLDPCAAAVISTSTGDKAVFIHEDDRREVVEVRLVLSWKSRLCVHIPSREADHEVPGEAKHINISSFDPSVEMMAAAQDLPVGAWVTHEKRVEARYVHVEDPGQQVA